MNNVEIRQIFYDNETKKHLDPGFIPLDNSRNERSDWREYWPIRNFLLENSLDENVFYGFFSVKFGQKTGLNADQCRQFISQTDQTTDLVLFSPFFDQSAFFQNIFLHGIERHPVGKTSFEHLLEVDLPNRTLDSFLNHSGNTVFCNFFVAKPKFWKIWFDKCEVIFEIAESRTGDFSKNLNSFCDRYHNPVHIKVFLIERIASYILATTDSWKADAYDPLLLPFSQSHIANEKADLIQLDALKIAYEIRGSKNYLDLYFEKKQLLKKRLRLQG